MTLLACCSGCDAQSKLERTVGSATVGSSGDMWLVKDGIAGRERVGLIFGFVSDTEACVDLATTYNDRYPRANLTCEPANH